MDENDPRSHAGRAGHRSEGAMGSRKGRTRAGIITADLRVMGTPTRSRPLARSVAAHVVAFLFDNGLTDEWGRGRCDLHACHLDHPSLAQLLAPLNVNVKGLRDGKARAKGPRRTRSPPLSAVPAWYPSLGSDIGVQSFSLVPLLDESGHCAVNFGRGQWEHESNQCGIVSLARGGHVVMAPCASRAEEGRQP